MGHLAPQDRVLPVFRFAHPFGTASLHFCPLVQHHPTKHSVRVSRTSLTRCAWHGRSSAIGDDDGSTVCLAYLLLAYHAMLGVKDKLRFAPCSTWSVILFALLTVKSTRGSDSSVAHNPKKHNPLQTRNIRA